jgi:hypothetical protein
MSDEPGAEPHGGARQGVPPYNDVSRVTGAAVTDTGPPNAARLLLASIRAIGYATSTASADTLRAASSAAGTIDRCLAEINGRTGDERIIVLGWAAGAAPDPDQHRSSPPRRLSGVPYLVWATCLAAAWPDVATDPYPGRPFSRDQILRTCVGLSAARNAVVGALDRLLPATGLVIFVNGWGMLGPAAAALPPDTWSELRRIHDRLPHSAQGQTPPSSQTNPLDAEVCSPGAGLRWIPGPPTGPTSASDTIIRGTVAALEHAHGPVARADLPSLADPAIRAAVTAALHACGRTLIAVADRGWTTGYTDAIASALADAHCGTLSAAQRAVLALVLLRTIAIPRARGLHHDDSWSTTEHATTLEELAANRHLTQTAIVDALRGLRAAGYVATTPAGGYVPGPALARLTPRLRGKLWENLVVLGRPGGYLADRIRQRRELPPASKSDIRSQLHGNEGQA